MASSLRGQVPNPGASGSTEAIRGDCTFSTQWAGEIRIDDLVGIGRLAYSCISFLLCGLDDYEKFLKSGGRAPCF